MSIPTGLNEHFKGTGKRRIPKRAFDSEDDAWNFINTLNIKNKVVYKCGFCGKYHIGG